MTRQSVVNF